MSQAVQVATDLVGAPCEEVHLDQGHFTSPRNPSSRNAFGPAVCRLFGNGQSNVHAFRKKSVDEGEVALGDIALLECNVHGRDGLRVLAENYPTARAEIQSMAGLRR